MSESYFLSHVVLEHAKSFAGQLADALACFIPPKDQTPLSPEYDPSGHDTTRRNTAAEYFIAGLVRALELKAKLVLSRKRYKLVFFASGDKFDPEAMVRDTDTRSNSIPKRKRNRMGLPKRQEPDNEAPVRLCLFPALYSKEEEEHGKGEEIGVGISDCLVNCANITVSDADAIDRSYKVVVKAVVSI
jgi:hypothetical protein